jgi:hypothetical protein
MSCADAGDAGAVCCAGCTELAGAACPFADIPLAAISTATVHNAVKPDSPRRVRLPFLELQLAPLVFIEDHLSVRARGNLRDLLRGIFQNVARIQP